MTTKIFVYAGLALLVLGTACSKHSKNIQLADSPVRQDVYSKSELERLIVNGMSIEDVTNKFGLPDSSVNEGENRIHLLYLFRFDPRRTESGFGIDIKNGRVIRWDTIKQGPVSGLLGGQPQGSNREQSFIMLLVSDNFTNAANVVDLQGSADATDLSAEPGIAFKAKVFADDSGGRSGKRTVILVMSEQDSSKLNDLIEQNVGKRFLILCRNRVIAAPVISVPINSRQLEFSVKDSNVVSGILGR